MVNRLPGGYRFPRFAFALYCAQRWLIDLPVDIVRWAVRR